MTVNPSIDDVKLSVSLSDAEGKVLPLLVKDPLAFALEVQEMDLYCLKIKADRPLNLQVVIGDHIWLLDRVVTPYACRYDSRSQPFFRNFMGLTQIVCQTEEGEVLWQSGAINVRARRLTYQKMAQFLGYIEQQLHTLENCLTPAKQQLFQQGEQKNLTQFQSGMRVLEALKRDWSSFVRSPCVTQQVQAKLAPYQKQQGLSAEGLAYLVNHPEELLPSCPQNADVRLLGQSYQIAHTLALQAKQDFDIYENQVILAFLQHFQRFLIQLKPEQLEGQLILGEADAYSLKQLLVNSGVMAATQAQEIEQALNLAQYYQGLWQQHFPCQLTSSQSYLPFLSQKVLFHPHYQAVYHLINDYYVQPEAEPFWATLLGLQSTAVIYEQVVLVHLIEGLTALGFQLQAPQEKRDPNSSVSSEMVMEPYYEFIHPVSQISAQLYYDLAFCSVSELESHLAIGQGVDLVHKSGQMTWRPDFVLCFQQQDQQAVHIMDAKFSTELEVIQKHLPSCSDKYGLRSRVLARQQGDWQLVMADSVTIFYSADNKPYQSVLQSALELTPFLKTLYPVKPELGYIGVESHSEEVVQQWLTNLLMEFDFTPPI